MTALSIARRESMQQAWLPDHHSFVQGDFEIAIVSDGYITVPIDISLRPRDRRKNATTF